MYRCCDKTSIWLKSDLSNRTQIAVQNNRYSDEAHIKSGVSQGSVLGPLEFLIHINDLPLSVKSSRKLIFADDATLFNSANPTSGIKGKLTENVGNVSLWCARNYMVLIIPKCNSTLLSTRQKHSHSNLSSDITTSVNDVHIPLVNTTKF